MMEVETPYTVGEVAKLTGFSPQTVTKLFEHEPGVLILASKKRNGKRNGYRSIRIPRVVYERVIRRDLAQLPWGQMRCTFSGFWNKAGN